MKDLRRIAYGVLALPLAAIPPLEAQQTVQLANGDRLTGTLSAVTDDGWVFQYAGGELKLAVESIIGFATPEPIGVRLRDGTIAAVTVASAADGLRLAARDGSVRIVAPSDVAAVGDAADLDALVPVAVGYFTPLSRFWGATTSLGFSNKSWNSRSRDLAASIEVRRASPKDRVTVKAGVNLKEAGVEGGGLESTVEKYYGSLRVDVFLSPRVFGFGVSGQERDTFQDIDLRSNYNAGMGYQLVATEASDLRFYQSAGYRVEKFTSGGSSSTAVIATGAGFRQDVGPALLTWSLDWAPSVKDFADYRILSEASLTATVYQGLGFRVASRNEFNNAPSVGVQKHDWLVTTTLAYTVGS